MAKKLPKAKKPSAKPKMAPEKKEKVKKETKMEAAMKFGPPDKSTKNKAMPPAKGRKKKK